MKKVKNAKKAPLMRVGAVQAAGPDEVCLLGYGVLLGEEIPSEKENAFFHWHQLSNPKIQLDDGSIVWGFQCWWDSEQAIKALCQKAGKVVEAKP